MSSFRETLAKVQILVPSLFLTYLNLSIASLDLLS